jgi:hypothetical protein
LNTFDNTYTKDLIIDGTITVSFSLSESDFQQIITKMLQIDFFSYPDTFLISTGDTVCYITPHSTYNFEVNYKSNIKYLYWSDSIVSQDRVTSPEGLKLLRVKDDVGIIQLVVGLGIASALADQMENVRSPY